MIKSFPLFILLLTLAACATTAQPRYNWGSYSNALVTMNDDAAATPAYVHALAKIVNGPPGKVPPGIYAEYGYMLQQQHDDKDAAAMYAREKSTWPASAQLMDKMTLSLQGVASAAIPAKPAS